MGLKNQKSKIKNQILIDLDKFYQEKELIPPCDELKSIIEDAIRYVICRHCEDAGCVISCPQDALKKEGEHLRRSNYLCTGCKTCMLACPFGVNIDEIVEYKRKSFDWRILNAILKVCDFIEEGRFEESEGVIRLDDDIYVKTLDWKKQLGR